MSETWLSFCVRDPAPLEKTGYFPIGRTRDLLTIDGEVKHSMEGSYAVARGMMFDSSLQKSWTLSVPKVGPPVQHYPIEYITWTSGGPEPNIRFVATETEGKVGEPLTVNQIYWSAQISKALRDLCPAISVNPPARRVNLWEHNEMTRFGAAFTTCPSGRIPWNEIIRLINEGDLDDLTAEEKTELFRLLNAAVYYLELINARTDNLVPQWEETNHIAKELSGKVLGTPGLFERIRGLFIKAAS